MKSKFLTTVQRHGRQAAVTVLGVAALAGAGAAQARDDVFWSIGVASPGVQLGVSNARPVYVQPAPVYVQPAPVVAYPAPVVVRPPIYSYTQVSPPVVVGYYPPPPPRRHHFHHRGWDRNHNGVPDRYEYRY